MVFYKPRFSLLKKPHDDDTTSSQGNQFFVTHKRYSKPTAASTSRIISRFVSGALDSSPSPTQNTRPLSGSSITAGFVTLNAHNVTLQEQVYLLQENNQHLTDQLEVLVGRLMYTSRELQAQRTINHHQARELKGARAEFQRLKSGTTERNARHDAERREFNSVMLDIELARIMQRTQYVSVDDFQSLQDSDIGSHSTRDHSPQPSTPGTTPEFPPSIHPHDDLYAELGNMVVGMIHSNRKDYGSWKSKLNAVGLSSYESFTQGSKISVTDSMEDVKAVQIQCSVQQCVPPVERNDEDEHALSDHEGSSTTPADVTPAKLTVVEKQTNSNHGEDVSLESPSFSSNFFECLINEWRPENNLQLEIGQTSHSPKPVGIYEVPRTVHSSSRTTSLDIAANVALVAQGMDNRWSEASETAFSHALVVQSLTTSPIYSIKCSSPTTTGTLSLTKRDANHIRAKKSSSSFVTPLSIRKTNIPNPHSDVPPPPSLIRFDSGQSPDSVLDSAVKKERRSARRIWR